MPSDRRQVIGGAEKKKDTKETNEKQPTAVRRDRCAGKSCSGCAGPGRQHRYERGLEQHDDSSGISVLPSLSRTVTDGTNTL